VFDFFFLKIHYALLVNHYRALSAYVVICLEFFMSAAGPVTFAALFD